MTRVPRVDPAKRLLFLSDRTLVTRREDPATAPTVIRNPSPADLARVIAAIDGVRTTSEICAALAADLDAETVADLLEALEGVVLAPAPGPVPAAVEPVTIVGRGPLALALASALHPRRPVRVLLVGGAAAPAPRAGPVVEPVAAADLGARLRGLAVIVAVHEAGTLGDALEVNRAAVAAGVTCVHVVAEVDTLALGPTTVPWRTPCLECAQIVWFFRNLATPDASSALRSIPLADVEDAEVRQGLIGAVTRQLDLEIAGVLTGQPFPTHIGAITRFTLGARRTVHVAPSTTCESCGGLNPLGITTGVGPVPALAPLERTAHGTTVGRSVGLAEARRRVEAALASLGVEVKATGYSTKIRKRYPELLQLPFVHAAPRRTFRPDAPLISGSLPDQCFGRGSTDEQALVSGMFELLERISLEYRGGVALVRAPYEVVREHAIDMPAFTGGLLDVPDRGPRPVFDPAVDIDWAWARCLRTGRSRLVPATNVLFARGSATPTLCRFRGAQFEMPIRGSSGCAAGTTREDAILAGLYEVIEHDARLMRQRSGTEAPAIPLDTITDPESLRLLELLQRAGFDVRLRAITVDIGLPVIEVYLTSRKDLTFHRVPGWGVHHDPAIALRRALSETALCIGGAEAVQDQKFRTGAFSITGSFHESRYVVERVRGTVAFGDLPRPDPRWTTTMDYVDDAVRLITAALPAAELCVFEYPVPTDDVFVVGIVTTGLINNLTLGHTVQDRLKNAPLLTGTGTRPLTLDELYLGDVKI